MKKSKIFILIATIILVALTVVAVAAATLSDATLEIIDAIINGEEYDVVNDLNGDGEIDIRDVILGVKKDNFDGPKLQTLTLDGGYAVEEEVKYDNFTYTVQLPAGRPRIPHITATTDAENATVAYQNATIADNETYGYAKVIISDNNGENVYTVKFVRAEVEEKNATIALQYDDRWTFTPNSNATGIKFTSSAPETASVNEDTGEITALAVTNGTTTPVTISATVGSEVVDTLTISRIDKAVINLFFVTGQSNAQGCYDFVDTDGDGTKSDEEKYAQSDEQLEDVIQPEKSGQVYIYDARPFWNSNNTSAGTAAYILPTGMERFYDLHNIKRAGFASALGKTYYDMSGEKVAFLHAAYNGSCIEKWLDPAKYPDLAEDYAYDKEGIEHVNHYVNAQKAYAKLLAELGFSYNETSGEYEPSDKYEINHKANFWLQGETCMSSIWDYNGGTSKKGDWRDPTASEKLFSSEDYTDMFMKFHGQMKTDFQIETNNIILVRAHGSIVTNADTNVKAALNNVRSSQYGMANSNGEITIVSRFSDLTVRDNSKYVGTIYEPYIGTMGVGNVHYNQTGHNINGIWAATNYFKKLDVDTTSVATSVEIIDTDGIKRFAENEAIGEFEVGNTKRIAAFALPEYSLENVTYSTSNDKVANVNEYGLITIVGEGEATITATAESGASASIVVKGIARTTAPTAFTINEGYTKLLTSYLPEFRFADITYTSDNEEVATVSDKGVITAVGGGEANIKALSNTGAFVEFVVTGIAKQVVKDSVHYRWDFNGDLTSSEDENDLRLSELAKQNGATEESYKFMEDGTIFIDKTIDDKSKPDFTMAYPVTVSSETDWTIEWRAQFTSAGVIIGRDNCYVASKKYLSHIYSIYTTSSEVADFDNVTYPLRFNDNNCEEYFLTYTSEYANMNKVMNTWKLDYKKYTGKMTLSVLVNDVWTAIDVIEPGEFTATYNNIFGRYNADGMVNFDGYMDYLDIKVDPAEVLYDTHYRWDFETGNEYGSTYDENTLTTTSSNQIIADGKYQTTTNAGEVKLEKPIVFDTKHDWMIEIQFTSPSNNNTLFGTENCRATGSDRSHFYFAASTWGGVIHVVDDANNNYTFDVPFSDAAAVQDALREMNTWRIGYDMNSNTMAVWLYDKDTSTWNEVGKNESVPPFTLTATCMFGDYNGNGMVSMKGTVEYVDVLIEASKAVGSKEYVYNWEFDNFDSTALSNPLTVPSTTQYTLSGGQYSVSASKQAGLNLENGIKLDSTHDWYIEWRSIFNQNTGSCMLIGTEDSQGKYNLIYLASSTSAFGTGKIAPVRIRDTAGNDKYLEYIPGETTHDAAYNLTKVWNTWRLKYDCSEDKLSLLLYNAETGAWDVCNSMAYSDFEFEFTTLFGNFNSSYTASFRGSMDYVKISYTK